MSITLLKKIGASDILGKVATVVRENLEVGEQVNAYGVAGVCAKIEKGTSAFGEWTRFVGDFQAVNYITGETFRSEKTHVPNVLEAVILRDLKPLLGASTELTHTTVTALSDEVEFAYTVQLKRLEDDDKGGVSWEYVTTPKTELKQNDRISHLTKMLSIDAPAEEPALIEKVEKPKAAPKAKK